MFGSQTQLKTLILATLGGNIIIRSKKRQWSRNSAGLDS